MENTKSADEQKKILDNAILYVYEMFESYKKDTKNTACERHEFVQIVLSRSLADQIISYEKNKPAGYSFLDAVGSAVETIFEFCKRDQALRAGIIYMNLVEDILELKSNDLKSSKGVILTAH